MARAAVLRRLHGLDHHQLGDPSEPVHAGSVSRPNFMTTTWQQLGMLTTRQTWQQLDNNLATTWHLDNPTTSNCIECCWHFDFACGWIIKAQWCCFHHFPPRHHESSLPNADCTNAQMHKYMVAIFAFILELNFVTHVTSLDLNWLCG